MVGLYVNPILIIRRMTALLLNYDKIAPRNAREGCAFWFTDSITGAKLSFLKPISEVESSAHTE
jgi:hypothetical protein